MRIGRNDDQRRAMLDEYEVTEEQLQQDMLHLIDELASHGLLQVDESRETG